jgi:hypothetical protein
MKKLLKAIVIAIAALLVIGNNFVAEAATYGLALYAFSEQEIAKQEEENAMLAQVWNRNLTLSKANQVNTPFTNEISWLQQLATSTDTSYILISAHGSTSGVRLQRTDGTKEFVTYSAIKQHLDQINGKKVVIFNACHAGAFADLVALGNNSTDYVVITAAAKEDVGYGTILIADLALGTGWTDESGWQSLRADYNYDDKVTLAELRQWLHQRRAPLYFSIPKVVFGDDNFVFATSNQQPTIHSQVAQTTCTPISPNSLQVNFTTSPNYSNSSGLKLQTQAISEIKRVDRNIHLTTKTTSVPIQRSQLWGEHITTHITFNSDPSWQWLAIELLTTEATTETLREESITLAREQFAQLQIGQTYTFEELRPQQEGLESFMHAITSDGNDGGCHSFGGALLLIPILLVRIKIKNNKLF